MKGHYKLHQITCSDFVQKILSPILAKGRFYFVQNRDIFVFYEVEGILIYWCAYDLVRVLCIRRTHFNGSSILGGAFRPNIE